MFRVKRIGWKIWINWINVDQIFAQSLPLATTAQTTLLNIVNVDLSVSELFFLQPVLLILSPVSPFYLSKSCAMNTEINEFAKEISSIKQNKSSLRMNISFLFLEYDNI